MFDEQKIRIQLGQRSLSPPPCVRQAYMQCVQKMPFLSSCSNSQSLSPRSNLIPISVCTLTNSKVKAIRTEVNSRNSDSDERRNRQPLQQYDSLKSPLSERGAKIDVMSDTDLQSLKQKNPKNVINKFFLSPNQTKLARTKKGLIIGRS